MADSPSLSIGFLLFPGVTQLDLTGPYEVFVRASGAQVHLIWKQIAPVISDRGLAILPTVTLDECPAPPFNSGSPRSAETELVQAVRLRQVAFIEKRKQATQRAAARL